MSGEGMPGAERPEPGGKTGSTNFSAPLGSVRSGRLVFASGASNVTILGEPALPGLYRARFEGREPTVGALGGTVTVRYPSSASLGWLNFRRGRHAEVALNASIPWCVEIRDGASGLTADLSGLELGWLDLAGGASRVDVTLPEPSGAVSVRIFGGASNLIIRRPAGVPVRVREGGGATNLTFDEERFGAVGGEVDLRSPDHDGAADRYDIAITDGANAVTVGTR